MTRLLTSLCFRNASLDCSSVEASLWSRLMYVFNGWKSLQGLTCGEVFLNCKLLMQWLLIGGLASATAAAAAPSLPCTSELQVAGCCSCSSSTTEQAWHELCWSFCLLPFHSSLLVSCIFLLGWGGAYPLVDLLSWTRTLSLLVYVWMKFRNGK